MQGFNPPSLITSRSKAMAPSSAERIRITHAIGFYAVFLIIATVWSFSQNRALFFFPYLSTKGLYSSVLWGLFLATIVIIASYCLPMFFSWAVDLERRFAKYLTSLNFSEIVILALLSGTIEELFFRGTMQPSFGLIATTIIFALAHLVPSRQWIAWFFLTLPIGFFLGLLFAKTQNLWGCIIAHTLINGINLSLLNMKFQGKRSVFWNIKSD